MNLPPISDFIELVKATDEDAAHRLPLLYQAAPILYDGAHASDSERDLLAEKFERWRYQRLNRFGSRLSLNERRLVTALDLAAITVLKSRSGPKAARTGIRAPLVAESDFEAAFDPENLLRQITERAAAITAEHFSSFKFDEATTPAERDGSSATESSRRMRLYAPLYLSNYCVNHCVYCGFRFPHQIDRVHLTAEQAMAEAEVLHAQGHRHLLIVAGDFPKLTSIEYLTTIVSELSVKGFDLSIEVAPQTTVAYKKLVRAGATGVTLYQETYQEQLYYRLHPRGPKVWFDWRLEALERAAEAGMKRLGLGILLGLADPRLDLRALIRHGQYLRERYPEIRLAFSLPRIHEAPEGFTPDYPIDDEKFIRMYCALRFAFPDAELVLSTREQSQLRDRLARICVTRMSAGSCTAPGGYSGFGDAPHLRQQFPIYDQRTTPEVAVALRHAGFELLWNTSTSDKLSPTA